MIIVNYPGFEGYQVRRGALGSPRPAGRSRVVDAATRQPLPVRRARRDRRPAQGRLVPREGPRLDGRRRLRPSRRALGRRHHLGGLDAERARDRAGAARASRGPRGGGHRRARRAARPGAAGVDRGATPRRRARVRGCRSTCASASAATSSRGTSSFVDVLPRTPAGKVDRHALRTRSAGRPAVSFPTITDEALASLRARIGRPVRRPGAVHRDRHPRRHPSLGARHRRPQPAVGRRPRWRRRRSCSRWTASCRVTSAACPGSTRCTAAPTSAGAGRSARTTSLVGASVLLDLEDKASAFARRSIKQTYRTTFATDDGAVVCEADSWCFRTERDTARERAKYGGGLEPHRYSAEALSADPRRLPERAGPRRHCRVTGRTCAWATPCPRSSRGRSR